MDVDNKNEDEASIDIGALLIEARNNLGLATKDIAEALNLADEVISEIEKNNFNQEFPVAFIRGYVKSYATKVGLDTSPILNEFDRQTGVVSPSLKSVKAISSFDKKAKEINSGHLLFKGISVLIVIVFLSYAGWKLWERLQKDTSNSGVVEYSYDTSDSNTGSDISNQLETDSVKNQSESLPENSAPANSPSGKSSTTENLITETAAKDDSSQVVILQQKSNENEIIVAPLERLQDTSQGSLDESDLVMTSVVLDFSADCWVKITDARGEILAEGIKVGGKHMPLQGVKPITVILGDPSAVTLSYENQSFDLSSYRAGRRADIVLN